MKKVNIKEFNFRDLFYKEKFIIILSIVLAFIIWIVISSNETESRPITVSNIPIDINLSNAAINDGLRVFSGENLTAEVSVTGNRIVVGQLTESDIRVAAQQASSIMSPGNYTLELTPKKASGLTDYEFASGVIPGFITIMVDRYKEIELNVEDGIKYKSNPEYFAGSTIFSSPKVKISGPESEISKIQKVVAEAEIPGVLDKTKNLKVPLTMYDSYGDVISNENIILSESVEDVTIPILPRKVLPVIPTLKNNPESINIDSERIKVSPDNIEIAAPEETFKAMNSVSLTALDFSKVNPSSTTFELPLDLPTGCRSIRDIYNVKVTIDLSDYSSVDKTVTDFTFINLPENKQASVSTKELTVSVAGMLGQVKGVSTSNLIGQIDMSGKTDFTGSTEMPVSIKVKDKNTCWVYGEYKVNIEVFDK